MMKKLFEKMYISNFQLSNYNMFIVFNIALFLCLSTIQAVPVETNPETTTKGRGICPLHSPCGWAFYIPSTKKVDFFIGNKCICAPENVCVRVEDNEMIGAIVYHCEIKPEETTENDTKN